MTEILAAIQGSHLALEAEMDLMAMDIDHLQLDLRKISERVTEAEGDVSQMQQMVLELQATVVVLKSNTTQMECCLKDAEGLSRCNNLWFLGFHEKAEGPEPDQFQEDWTTSVSYNLKAYQNSSILNRPMSMPQPGAPWHALTACFFNYRDRDALKDSLLFPTKLLVHYQGNVYFY
ncbi:hypothetical protein NDU88_001095 [Pleurodeles waltl]|uniref:Uncharacterized protein n=1 Tax=Pleurodeles waltl TaxID=8319 RepID=A0AAV7TGM9_PLEWA|nr:hypothetical protein NDU88_001095 [Pleurodeles waltl]